MGHIIYPPPLQPGDIIGITAPSAGFGPALEARYQFAVRHLHNLGYRVKEGHCLRSPNEAMASAPARERAAELTEMLQDSSIAAVIPPWGGEILIDILPLLDFSMLSHCKPKWILGYSDLSTLILPYTLLTHTATAHGSNLMEAPNIPPEQLASWHDVMTLPAGRTFTQHPAPRYQIDEYDWRMQPHVRTFNCTETANWKCLEHELDEGYEVTVSGRLLGGCLDVISMLPGTPYGDVNRFADDAAPEGLLLYLENVDGNTAQYCRMLYAVRLSGWFEHANALLIGRSAGAQLREYTNHDVLNDALGGLHIPVIYDIDIGHRPPQLMLVNGALASLHFKGQQSELTQVLL